MAETAKLTACEINERGEVTVTLSGGNNAQTFTIPASQASDALLMLVKAMARASTKPGSPYRTLLAAPNVALERTALAAGGWVPVICFQMDPEAQEFLRFPLRFEALKSLAEGLQTLDQMARHEAGSKRAN